jgi:hypothetical protein
MHAVSSDEAAMEEAHRQPGHIQLDSAPVGRRSVRLIELDGRTLLYDDEIRHWVVLNGTASALWHCLDGSGTVGEIAEDLGAVFSAEVAKVQEEILFMVRVLGQQGLLEGVVPVGVEDEIAEADAPRFPRVRPTT